MKTDIREEAACQKQLKYWGVVHHFLFPIQSENNQTELLSSHSSNPPAKVLAIPERTISWKKSQKRWIFHNRGVAWSLSVDYCFTVLWSWAKLTQYRHFILPLFSTMTTVMSVIIGPLAHWAWRGGRLASAVTWLNMSGVHSFIVRPVLVPQTRLSLLPLLRPYTLPAGGWPAQLIHSDPEKQASLSLSPYLDKRGSVEAELAKTFWVGRMTRQKRTVSQVCRENSDYND